MSPVGLSSGGVLFACVLRFCCNVVRFDDGFCPVGLVALLVATAGVAAGAAGCVPRVVAYGGCKVRVGAFLAPRVDGCAARVTGLQDRVLRLVGMLVVLIDSAGNRSGCCPKGQIIALVVDGQCCCYAANVAAGAALVTDCVYRAACLT